ncbi:LysM peptidoglycan-binding domain-containing protein [uncultured Psychroserpens sp.]|uniref:LysM peptidoglycan-binding domain-containing protein n=1 Tax=uncultured Psychroserpens sp. TaxID=255436 RepID=UPI00260870EE|nr:LysM peptidoglycan-binding domain-containing protein [uncultured Psychroserpens sp.]
MLKSFKLCITVLVVTASSIGAVAQTETYKDVLLDGKPAKLNTKTGEVILVDAKSTTAKAAKAKDSKSKTTDQNSKQTEIKANLITTTQSANTASDLKEKTQSKMDVAQPVDSPKKPLTPEKSSQAEKATTMVYDTSLPETETTNSNFHKVKKGETLYGLSKRYNVSLEALKRANDLETTLIKTGETLRVKNLDALYDADIWIVSKDDTLYSIAKKTNTTVAALKALNGLQSNLIKIGQKLQLR